MATSVFTCLRARRLLGAGTDVSRRARLTRAVVLAPADARQIQTAVRQRQEARLVRARRSAECRVATGQRRQVIG